MRGKTASIPPSTAPTLRVYQNTSAVFLAWEVPGKYEDLEGAPCLGFSIERQQRTANGAETTTVLSNYVGFEKLTGTSATGPKQSDQWPLQRFTWTDFSAPVNLVLSYRVTPVFGKLPASGNAIPKLNKGKPSAWSESSRPMAGRDGALEAYFNFGIIASQWFDRLAATVDPKGTLLKTVFSKGGKGARSKGPSVEQRKAALDVLLDKPIPKCTKTMRQGLGGALLEKLYSLLDEVANTHEMQIYCAFYELDEPGVVERLKKIGKRANVILGNGAYKGTKSPDPEVKIASKLRNIVNLTRRKFTGGGFVHNKFIVFTRANGSKATAVWTGSTNMTTTGCCTQVNNAVLINDETVGTEYLNQWRWLKASGNSLKRPEPPAQLCNQKAINSAVEATVWFTPTGKLPAKISGQRARNPHLPDLEYAGQLVANARQGILCLFFEPGPSFTLLSNIIAAGQAKPNELYVRGVVNADPSSLRRDAKTGKLVGTQVAGLLHQDKAIPAAFDIVLPEGIQQGSSDWLAAERAGFDIVRIHSKCIVLDPNGDHPVVITGSHNLGPKASTKNDENLVILEGDAEVAGEFAAHIMSVFNHFWYRFNQSSASQKYASTGTSLGKTLKTRSVKPWGGLKRDSRWQEKFFTPGSPESIEFRFWAP